MSSSCKLWNHRGFWPSARAWVVAIALGVLAPQVDADVFIDQRPDGRDDLLSYWHHGSSFQVGDDFQPERPTVVTSVSFWLIATFPRVPFNWSFAVHRSDNENDIFGFGPTYPWFHFQSDPSSVTDLGIWKERDGTHLFEVTWSKLNLLLDPADTVEGTFWFSPGGWSNHRTTRSWWLTSGEGVVNGNETWGKSYPIYEPPGWVKLSLYLDRDPSDYAMRIEGYVIPAPPVAALLLPAALAPLHAGRKRTRSSASSR
jgi:hypothetical protein